jgi:hypothetical protein
MRHFRFKRIGGVFFSIFKITNRKALLLVRKEKLFIQACVHKLQNMNPQDLFKKPEGYVNCPSDKFLDKTMQEIGNALGEEIGLQMGIEIGKDLEKEYFQFCFEETNIVKRKKKKRYF